MIKTCGNELQELLEFRELAKFVGRCNISNIYQRITRISGARKVCRGGLWQAAVLTGGAREREGALKGGRDGA